MINKELEFKLFKLKTLNLLYAQNRVLIGKTGDEQNLWNRSIIPEELKKIIDDLYRSLSQIAIDNNISTPSINQLIDGSRAQTNVEAEILYKKKCLEQMDKMQEVINHIENELTENNIIKVEEERQIVRNKMHDEKNNEQMQAILTKKITDSIQKVQNTMSVELLSRGGNPNEIERKTQKILQDIVFSTKEIVTNKKIKDSLDLDDEKVTNKIMNQIENLSLDLNKTERQKFAETIQVENSPQIPKSILESENKTKEYNKENMLDENVIE